MDELTPQQQKFTQYYMQGCNGAEAAKKAGYSPKNARQSAYALLQHEGIQAELRRLEHIQDNELRQEFRRSARKARSVLESILDDPTANSQAKVAAAKEVIMRGYMDTAQQQQEVTADDTRESIEAKFSSALLKAVTPERTTVNDEATNNERNEISDGAPRDTIEG
jgi:phage terminase small subunit